MAHALLAVPQSAMWYHGNQQPSASLACSQAGYRVMSRHKQVEVE